MENEKSTLTVLMVEPGKAPYRAPPQCGKYQKKLMKAAADERQRKRRRS